MAVFNVKVIEKMCELSLVKQFAVLYCPSCKSESHYPLDLLFSKEITACFCIFCGFKYSIEDIRNKI